MKHTKGPWESTGFNIQVKENLFYCLDNNSDTKSEELRANAALIAAAPEMLEALETLWASLTLDDCKRIETEVGPVYSQVLNAIAKARGVK